jgi:polyisoprenyl-phosphate glycosyltransferase
MLKHLISISIPVLNEELNIPTLVRKLQVVTEGIKEYEFEFVFTDNNSNDDTWNVLQRESKEEPRIHAFRFARNIGFQQSILFNYSKTSGLAVIQLDADMQDPPELITEFIAQWENGYKVVSGVRVSRSESKAINLVRSLGYWFIDLVSEHPIKRNTGDFRLLDRAIVDALVSTKSPDPYLRGIISSMGLVEKDVLYSRRAREFGESKFGLVQLFKLGLQGISNHSNLPLRIANFVGISSLIFSILGTIYYVAIKFLQPDLPRGYASIYILIIFGIGINSIILSSIGSYIRKIYKILSNQSPILVVDEIN